MTEKRRKMLGGKVHGATITQADLAYEGSLTMSPELLAASNILPNEAVAVWNVTTGARFETYAIEGEPGSNDVCANGAAAHLAKAGDKVIIASFVDIPDSIAKTHQPAVVFVDADNQIKELRKEIPGPALSRQVVN